jgi:hypothetical protein
LFSISISGASPWRNQLRQAKDDVVIALVVILA